MVLRINAFTFVWQLFRYLFSPQQFCLFSDRVLQITAACVCLINERCKNINEPINFQLDRFTPVRKSDLVFSAVFISRVDLNSENLGALVYAGIRRDL